MYSMHSLFYPLQSLSLSLSWETTAVPVMRGTPGRTATLQSTSVVSIVSARTAVPVLTGSTGTPVFVTVATQVSTAPTCAPWGARYVTVPSAADTGAVWRQGVSTRACVSRGTQGGAATQT